MAPHGYCLLWDPTLIWGSILSDGLITIAYLTIPAALVHVVRSRRDTGFGWLFWAFAVFIVACGVSHAMHIWNLWHGHYGVEILVKAVTAVASVTTAIVLWRILPTLVELPSQSDLLVANAELQQRVAERDEALSRLEKEVAERIRAETKAHILRVSRLSAMGAMASTIAHELNQPLTASSNYIAAAAQMVDELRPPQPALTQVLSKARAQSTRVSEIIKRMRAFTLKGEVIRQPTHPASLVNSALETLRGRFRTEKIEVVVDIASDVHDVAVDRVQIEQVLSNLFRNALDALLSSEQRRIQISAIETAEAVEFRVIDSGPGLKVGAGADVFQLFASTKPNGLGLGLPLCRTIVEAHGGRIWAESTAGAGATFVVALPIASDPPTSVVGPARSAA